MTSIVIWAEAVAAASAPVIATSLNAVTFTYNGQLAFASRHLIKHWRVSPVLSPTVAALAGLGGGA